MLKHILFFFKILFILFLDPGEGREKEREISVYGCHSRIPYWRPGPQPRHAPDGELKPQPFDSQSSTQSTEAHQPGHEHLSANACL